MAPGGVMLSEGARVGDFQLVGLLGKGGFGAVWRARDLRRGGEAALKVLHADLRQVRPGRGPSMADRFLAEARILHGLDHPGVVRVLDVLDDPARGVVAYAMEMLDGRELGALRPELDAAALIDVFAQVAATLGYLHGQGVLHRDVKPSNIFVCDAPPGGHDRAVKLIDFGIAKDLAGRELAESTATGMLVGTVQSMAPESFSRLDGADVELTGAVDQWGVGVALYRMISARAPFRSEAILGLMQEVLSRPHHPLVPADQFAGDEAVSLLEPVIARCLRKRPEDRFPSMAALAAELGRLSRELSAERTVGRGWGLAPAPWPLLDPEASAPTPLGQSAVMGAFDELDDLDEGAKTQVAGRRPGLDVDGASGEVDVVTQPPRPLEELVRGGATEDIPAHLVIAAHVASAAVVDPADFTEAPSHAGDEGVDVTRLARPAPAQAAAPPLRAPPPLPGPEVSPAPPGSPLLRATVPAVLAAEGPAELAMLPGPALLAPIPSAVDAGPDAAGSLHAGSDRSRDLRAALLGAAVVGLLGLLAIAAWFALR